MITMQPMNHLHAGESEYAAYASFVNVLRAERTPDLPPIPLAEQINRLQSVPPFMGYSVWTLTAGAGSVVAVLELARPQTDENRHLAQCMIQVLPEQRRRGHGRALLQQAAHLAQADGRRLLITTSYGAVPAGAAFLERLGASRGLETHTKGWTLYACERETGELAGYTAVYFQPNRPEQLSQGDTGVFPAYRRRGLGRWLKAAMLDKVLRQRPEVRCILTGNADSNAPMLKINHELGFRPYLSQTIWQIELQKILAYLAMPASA